MRSISFGSRAASVARSTGLPGPSRMTTKTSTETTSSRNGNWIRRLATYVLTLRPPSADLFAGGWVKELDQAVAEQVQAQHGQRDGGARIERQHRLIEDEPLEIVDHRTPIWRGWLNAEA